MSPDVRLDYDRAIVPQITYYSCGAASAEIVLNARGVKVPEQQLITEIGTTTSGTNDVSMITKVLNRYLPEANYRVARYEQDPMSREQREQCWKHIARSIRAGYGVIVNWWSPASNRPAGTKGSVPPNYPPNGLIMHYVAAMGISEDDRAVWIAEPGFSPGGFWCPWAGRGSVSSLIPPKGIGYADCAVAEKIREPEPPVLPKAHVYPPQDEMIRQMWERTVGFG